LPIQTNFIEELFDQIAFTVVDTQAVMSEFGLTRANVLNLCGGIPLPTITNIQVDISSQYKGALTIQISSDQYELIRMIDMDLRRIDNRVMVVEQEARGQGIGTNLFLNQVEAASQGQFIRLRTFTQAPSAFDDEDLDWQGYYFWANFGFVNIETEEFNQWATLRGREEVTLNDLMQSEEGRELWKQEGFAWTGDFILQKGHACFIFLQTYLQRKGIDWG